MKTSDNLPADVLDDVIELGVASIETQGVLPIGEPEGGNRFMGISEE
ncbi:benenodin family lasso peptide [Luteimonas sp. XNQY3]|nr:benenodin family lasso peptide [Luteimonas sp. XNQY3]MCD9007027.1 benenodin family lasso peptide [Luteimonas sp. XNQY3]